MSLHAAVSGWLLGPPSGANRRLLGLFGALRGLLAAGERVTVLHPAAWTPPWAHPRITFLPTPIPAGPRGARFAAEHRRLPRLLAGLGADLLDHGFLPAPRLPCRLVLTVHDTRHADGDAGARGPRWLHRAVLRRAIRRADAVVVPSRFTADRIAQLGGNPRRLAVIANAVDLAPAAPAADAGTFFLHVGHLEPRKNLHLLLRAFAALPADLRERRELRLVGADAGAGRRLREAAAALGIADRVAFLGELPDAALPPLYAGAAAVCVPSLHEGFGLCAAEAIAAGAPLLVADRGALTEITGDRGRVLPGDDPARWALAMAAPPPRRPPAPRLEQPWAGPAAALLDLWRTVAGGGVGVSS